MEKILVNKNEKIFQKGFRGSASGKKDGTGVEFFKEEVSTKN